MMRARDTLNGFSGHERCEGLCRAFLALAAGGGRRAIGARSGVSPVGQGATEAASGGLPVIGTWRP